MTETRYQRIAREQAERQAARAARWAKEQRAREREIRAQRRAAREKRFLEALTDDHNGDPGGDDSPWIIS
jgi:hypothetical protein